MKKVSPLFIIITIYCFNITATPCLSASAKALESSMLAFSTFNVCMGFTFRDIFCGKSSSIPNPYSDKCEDLATFETFCTKDDGNYTCSTKFNKPWEDIDSISCTSKENEKHVQTLIETIKINPTKLTFNDITNRYGLRHATFTTDDNFKKVLVYTLAHNNLSEFLSSPSPLSPFVPLTPNEISRIVFHSNDGIWIDSVVYINMWDLSKTAKKNKSSKK